MKNLLFSLTAVLLILLSGCDKFKIEGVPSCIEDELKEAADVCSQEKASLTAFLFQGEKVYILDPGNCIADGAVAVVNQNCDTLCSLGGFAGNVMCNGEIFYQAATDEELIWEEK